MDKKKIGIIASVSVVILIIGITIGFFIGKSTVTDTSASTATTDETAAVTEETTTETTTEETTTEITTTAPAKYETVSETVYATADVNIRNGASTSSTVISALKKGQSIERTAIGDNGWSKVTYKGKPAYISSSYLTTKNPQQSVNGGISNTDINNFREILAHIVYYDLDYSDFETTYNYKSEDAFEIAMRKMAAPSYYPLFEKMDEIYNWGNYDVVDSFYEPEGQKDPKGLWEQYKIIDAECVDLILENVFNVKPNHDYVLHDDDGNVCAYYYNNMYYFASWDGGDGVGPDILIKNVEKLSGEKYRITVDYILAGPSDDGGSEVVEDFGDLVITAEMKIVNEKTLWSFYEIKPVK